MENKHYPNQACWDPNQAFCKTNIMQIKHSGIQIMHSAKLTLSKTSTIQNKHHGKHAPWKTTSRRRTERKRTEDDETEQRRDERVLLDLVFDRLGGLSGRPSGRPVSDLPKTPPMGPGLAGAQNRHILNRTSIEKSSDSDGRRIREFSSSRTRPDLLLFRALGGTDFRVRFLRVLVSRIRLSKTLRSIILKPISG